MDRLSDASRSGRLARGIAFVLLGLALLVGWRISAQLSEESPSDAGVILSPRADSPHSATAELAPPTDPARDRSVEPVALRERQAETTEASLLVHVRSRGSGRPRLRVPLVLRPTNQITREDLAETSVTDDGGTARWTGLAPGRWSIESPDGAFSNVELSRGPSEVEILLDEGPRVEGVVVGADRRPLPGAHIHLARAPSSRTGPAIADTDAAGRFQIDDIGASRWICATAARFVASTWVQVPDLPAGAPGVELELVLGAEAARLVVTVLDPAEAPIDGAWVRVAMRPGALGITGGAVNPNILEIGGRTDPSGRYEAVGVRPGSVDVSVRARTRCTFRTSLRVAPGETTEVRAVLDLEARIVGSVRYATGEPILGASLSRSPHDGSEPALATSRSDGSFEIDGLAAGPISIRIQDRSGASASRDFDLRSGEEENWDCVLTVDGLLRGRVVDEDGEPRTDVQVVIHAADGEPALVLEPDLRLDGTFEARVARTGRFTIEVREDPNALDALAQSDTVEPDGGEVVLRIPRRRPATFVVGTLIGTDGRPVAASLACVAAGAEPGSAEVGSCDEHGRFRMGPFAAGTWKLLAGPAGTQLQVVARFEASPGGGDMELGTLRLRATGSIRVLLEVAASVQRADGMLVVRGEDGDALVARPWGSPAWGTPQVIDGLAPGRYFLEFQVGAARSRVEPVDVRAAGETVLRIFVPG